jgi:hypothetical protein
VVEKSNGAIEPRLDSGLAGYREVDGTERPIGMRVVELLLHGSGFAWTEEQSE